MLADAILRHVAPAPSRAFLVLVRPIACSGAARRAIRADLAPTSAQITTARKRQTRIEASNRPFTHVTIIHVRGRSEFQGSKSPIRSVTKSQSSAVSSLSRTNTFLVDVMLNFPAFPRSELEVLLFLPL